MGIRLDISSEFTFVTRGYASANRHPQSWVDPYVQGLHRARPVQDFTNSLRRASIRRCHIRDRSEQTGPNIDQQGQHGRVEQISEDAMQGACPAHRLRGKGNVSRLP